MRAIEILENEGKIYSRNSFHRQRIGCLCILKTTDAPINMG
jgi:hypothetical protein